MSKIITLYAEFKDDDGNYYDIKKRILSFIKKIPFLNHDNKKTAEIIKLKMEDING